jgi:hypothetical protein
VLALSAVVAVAVLASIGTAWASQSYVVVPGSAITSPALVGGNPKTAARDSAGDLWIGAFDARSLIKIATSAGTTDAALFTIALDAVPEALPNTAVQDVAAAGTDLFALQSSQNSGTQVLRFDGLGIYTERLVTDTAPVATSAPTPGRFVEAIGLSVDPGDGDVFVADGLGPWATQGGTIQRYDAAAGTWSVFATGFPGLTSLAVAPDHTVWVACEDRLFHLAADGSRLGPALTAPVGSPRAFVRLHHLATDAAGFVYVAHELNFGGNDAEVLKLDAAGALVAGATGLSGQIIGIDVKPDGSEIWATRPTTPDIVLLRAEAVTPQANASVGPTTTPDGDNGWFARVAPTVTLRTAGLGDVVAYGWNPASLVTSVAPPVSTDVPEGASTLSFFASDFLGAREPTRTLTVKYDPRPPAVSVGGIPATDARVTSVTPTFSVEDTGSGVATSSAVVTGKQAPAGFAIASGTRITRPGSWKLTVTATDTAGNVTATERQFVVRYASQRRAGANRYATALAVSAASFPASETSNVVIATGQSFPDALAGAPLARALRAPLILVGPRGIDASTSAELKRLGAKKAYLLGGEGAVSRSVADSLKTLAPERISGANRYETCAAVATKLGSVTGSTSTTAVVATGENFPDALAAAGWAARNGWPILLLPSTGPAGAPSIQARLGQHADLIALGGVNAGTFASKVRLTLKGATRYETAAKIASESVGVPGAVVASNSIDIAEILIADGQNFPDALAAGPVAAAKGAPMILVNKQLDTHAHSLIERWVANDPRLLDGSVRIVTYLGGTAVVPDQGTLDGLLLK